MSFKIGDYVMLVGPSTIEALRGKIAKVVGFGEGNNVYIDYNDVNLTPNALGVIKTVWDKPYWHPESYKLRKVTKLERVLK